MILRRYMVVTAVSLLATLVASGATINPIGTYANWPVAWTALPGLDDPDDGAAEQNDFVGNATYPGAYWSDDGSYIYFRMRLDVDDVDPYPFHDAHIVLIDVVGANFNTETKQLDVEANDGEPDYGFAWDSKSNDPAKHGLEMVVRSVVGPSWGTVQMDDIDGNNGQKLTNDINGNGRTTDGYVRATGLQDTTVTNFGNTTFLDYAVSWSYLETYTGIRRGQTLNIALGSINDATDHNALSGDIAGGALLTDTVTTTGWTSITPVPEPSSGFILGIAGLLGLCHRRR
jgi:hypothetical protein